MSIRRRDFLLQAGLAAAAWAVQPALGEGRAEPRRSICRAGRLWPVSLNPAARVPVRPALNVSQLTPFVDPLPIPPVASVAGSRPDPEQQGRVLPYYRIAMRPLESQVHRDLKPTRFWAYGGSMPGPTIEARSGQGLLVEWVNELPARHFLPIDYRLHGAGPDQPEVRTAVHVHGGRTPAASDGYPDDWKLPGQSALFHYPNRQDAATLWYHDHAMGINRLNIYAGLFGAYLIRAAAEEALELPGGPCDIPLLLCDRMFYRDDHQLDYPVSGYPDAPWVAELGADGTLVNGKLFPYLEVEPRKYRFRLICAANSSFYNLMLSDGLDFQQVGTDQGLLPAPVTRKSLLLAPAERADVVVDFSRHAGSRVVLSNIPIGILQFRVAGRSSAADASRVPAQLRPVAALAPAAAVKVRRMTLDQHSDRAGDPVTLLLNETPWDRPVTETPRLDTVEIWEFMNLTDEVHPIHLHLVRFQILNRQHFHVPDYLRSGKIVGLGPAVPPEPGEAGWKDTVQAYAGAITRIIVRFEGYTGRYLWHCHILEHEANDMMRPFEVIA